MENISIKLISKDNILEIIPLLQQLNTKTPETLLKERVLEMAEQNYECVGVYDQNNLIGISGLWTSTKHYIGKTVEPDHVVIDKNYRGQNLGKVLFSWIYEYAKSKGAQATELNAYSQNRKSHKFYLNEGYEIHAFHFVKVLRENGEFY